ncbi:MAG: septum formation initiator family protein [Prevotella sp.]|nr:septum formation initiator family protein [Prevotella sp.]MCF0208781.1 septum formation initiator family protein [Bacteroidaceae bacterium]
MTFINKILRFAGHNKYWLVLFLGVLIVGFTGDNSVLTHWKYQKEIDGLEEEIAAFNKQYEEDQDLIKQIQTNPHAIAKIAREQYFMKADDEDIFVFSTDYNNEAAK